MTEGKSRFPLSLIIISFILLTACNGRTIYSESFAMNDNVWKLPDTPLFEIPVTDTLNSSNIFFIVRTSSSYPYRNIYLFVTATSPDGRTLTDTLQYNLADEKGKRYGKGFGDVRELNLPFKSNVYFPAKGIYTFHVQHGMRIENLPGVYDFGLRIEKITK
jgi:gliding motility-associated lipoprotein GldH